MTEAFKSEQDRVEAVIDYVLKSLSGENDTICLDQEPTRRYSIGILSPQPPEDSTGKTSNKRKPTSIGFEATTEIKNGLALRVDIEFDVYWRAIPSWQEQLDIIPETARKNITESEGETRLRLKYFREHIKIDSVYLNIDNLPNDGASTLDVEPINIAIQKKLEETKQLVIANDRCWPASTKEFMLPISVLENEEKYENHIKTRLKQSASEKPSWSANFTLKYWPAELDKGRIAALLSNGAYENSDSKHPLALTSCKFLIKPTAGKFVSSPFAAAALDYRYESVSWGRGINCVLSVKDNGGSAETQSTPTFYQKRTITRSEVDDACLFSTLANDKDLESLSTVGDWLDGYAKTWHEDNYKWVGDASYDNRTRDLGKFEEEVARFRQGILALKADDRLSSSFMLANQAFSKGAHKNWRLFQLVFVVMQMPSLLAREQPTEDLLLSLNRVDVLWFPTGGGKTEAYFGVIAVALFYDRLRGKSRGVTAWLRYPLRMLSIQQLQRLMEIVVYADNVRLESSMPMLTNCEPFTLGYYVGEKNTPNNLTYAFDNPPTKKLLELKQRVDEATGPDDNPLLVLQRCPFCGSTNLGTDVLESEIRIKHICRDCSKELPIYITDTEIYRYAPSIIVGTVDRLARAGQTSQFAHIFGRFDKKCPDHGYLSFDQCLEKGVCNRKVSEFIKLPELHDPTPSLLLQDELHLLRESLGTYDSHFETFIDTLSESIGTGLPPKRLAATATIEGYEKHIQELYARSAARFPVKGMYENESAYVTPSLETPLSRAYVGILPTGSENKEVVYGILSALKEFADTKFVEEKSSEKSGLENIINNYDLSLAYVNQKNTAGDLRAYWNDPHEIQVLTGDRGLAEVRATIGRVESDASQPFQDRLKFLIATSVISHGVDLERLNFMAFAGLPATASDYIQASSRVGRTHLGVVFTVFRPENNRERNVYQRFYEYHERLYQLVQPIPINRVSLSAISRTITGILGACILNILGYDEGLQLGGFDKAKIFTKALSDGLITDEMLVSLARKSLGIERAQLPGDSLSLVDEHIFRLVKDERRLMQSEEGTATTRRMRPYPVSSLREVSEQVGFALNYRAAEVVTQLQHRKVQD